MARTRLTRLRRILALLPLLGVAACGSDAGDSQSGTTGTATDPSSARPLRLALQHERTGEVSAGDSLRLVPPDGVAPWVVAPGASRVGPVKKLGIERCLFIVGKGERTLTIHGSFDPSSFNQVVITLLGQMRSNVALVLHNDEGPPISSGTLPLKSSPHPQELIAGFALNAMRGKPYTRLVLEIPASAGPVGILALDLVQRSPASWLEHAEVHGGFARVDHELRRAQGLVDGEHLVTRMQPAAGDGFDFSYALAQELRLEGREPTLTLELSARGATTQKHSFKLERDDEKQVVWHYGRVPLEGFAGCDVEARFSVRDAAGKSVAAWVAEPTLFHARADQKSVLLITSDTHRSDHMAGAPDAVPIETPALDALAARGVFFESAWSTAELTLPSHIALLTGTHPRDTRIINNVTSLDDSAETLAEVFHDAGYRTFAVVTARHLGQEISGLGQGFERMFVPTAEAKGDLATARLLSWLDQVPDQPVFVWLHLFDAHSPYESPEKYSAAYTALARATKPTAALTREVLRARALYKGEVSYVDALLAPVLEMPHFAQGIVGFTSDHGEVLGTHGLYFIHEELYTHTLQVPLILAWPDAPAGKRIPLPLDHLGLARTLIELAGVDARDFPGTSLMGYLGDAAPDEQPKYALSFGGYSGSITWQNRHLIFHLVPHPIGKPVVKWTSVQCQVEFFDLSLDPGCEEDLIAERMQEAGRYRSLLLRWLDKARAEGWDRALELDGPMAARLAEFGYATEAVGGSGAWLDPEHECEWCERFEEFR